MRVAEEIKNWIISNGYEILAQKTSSDSRTIMIARKNYHPGFIKGSTLEIKNLRIAIAIESATSLMNQESKVQMNRFSTWKQYDNTSEKWLLLCVPQGTAAIDYSHLNLYNQVIEYPLHAETFLKNEPRMSPLGVLGWNP